MASPGETNLNTFSRKISLNIHVCLLSCHTLEICSAEAGNLCLLLGDAALGDCVLGDAALRACFSSAWG